MPALADSSSPGVLHHVLGVSSVAGFLIESVLFCVGFLIMIYALYRR
ncbi:DUF7521 family protein [Natronoglomus mannanivorans]